MFGRVVGERSDPVGTGAVQVGVDLGDGGVEFLAPDGDVCDVGFTSLLVLGQGAETLPKFALRDYRLLDPAFGGVDLGLGVGDGVMVEAPPPPPTGVLEPGRAVRQ